MNIEQIKGRLGELFFEEGYRVVLWNDPEEEFEEILEQLELDDVKIIRPDKIGQFHTKVLIELEHPTEKILVYSTSCEPGYEDDWLLDIRLYGYQFRADSASMLVEELGLRHHQLRDHVTKRKGFFASRERTERLKIITAPDDMEEVLDRKMMAVLVKSGHSDFFDIVRTLYGKIADSQNLDDLPKEWQQIIKFGLEEVFWKLVKETFEYTEKPPTLHNLLTTLFVTDLAHSVKEDIPNSLRHFILPQNKQSDVVVCLGQWRDSTSKTESYDILSELIAQSLNIREKLSELSPQKLVESVTFLEIEKIVASYLKDTIIETENTIDADSIKDVARKRQDMHWANCRLSSSPDIPRTAFFSVYTAIIAAADFFTIKIEYNDSLHINDPEKLFKSYTDKLYRIDQLYRRFCENADMADSSGWGILKDLRDRIEDVYCNWFLDSLAMSWDNCISAQSWEIQGVSNQYNFFAKYPQRVAGEKSSRGRTTAYVIVSDALRYEAAEELTRELNGKYRFVAKLESMLGVVPSYTALGMAALLPHNELGFTDKGDVLVNKKKCVAPQQRLKVLEEIKGTSIKADELLEMKREESRDFVRDKDIVYIYHNEIDAVGDDAHTEKDTFRAVQRTIKKLSDIVSYVINTLHAKYVYVTADHGFVFTQTKPNETDKNKIAVNKEDVVKANKRYLLGNDISLINDSVAGKVSDTAGVSPEADMAFVVPKGMSRFYFTGGSRFFHGGMSLQEVVIPVVVIEQKRGKAVEQTRERTVSVQVLGTDHRITTNLHRFQLLQTDAVSDRIKPLTIKTAVYDGDTLVTDIQNITFNSRSDNMSDRTQWVSVTLLNREYDKNKSYHFVLRDVETNIEVGSVAVKIDRLFSNDF
jgi:uncharacterized protein (TIGR02687 family)